MVPLELANSDTSSTDVLVRVGDLQLLYIWASINIVPSSRTETSPKSWVWWKLKRAGDERRKVG